MRLWRTRRAYRSAREATEDLPDQGEARIDLGDPDLLSGVRIAACQHRHSHRQFAISGIGMVAPQITIKTASPLHRTRRPLVERDLLRQDPGRDQPVEMAVGAFQHRRIAADLPAQPIELVTQPRLRIKIAAQTARNQQISQKPAAGQTAVDLFDALFEKHALGLADFQGRRVGEMAKIVQMVVETFEFGTERAQQPGARRTSHAAARSTAWQKASAWAKLPTPDTRSASATACMSDRPANRFSIPRCLKNSCGW